MFIRTVGAVRRRQPGSLNIYLSNLYSIYDLSIFVHVSSSLLRIIAICGVPPRVSVSPVSLWCKCTVVACPGSSALIHLEKEGRYLVNVYSVFKVPVGTFVHDH